MSDCGYRRNCPFCCAGDTDNHRCDKCGVELCSICHGIVGDGISNNVLPYEKSQETLGVSQKAKDLKKEIDDIVEEKRVEREKKASELEAAIEKIKELFLIQILKNLKRYIQEDCIWIFLANSNKYPLRYPDVLATIIFEKIGDKYISARKEIAEVIWKQTKNILQSMEIEVAECYGRNENIVLGWNIYHKKLIK